VWQDPINGCADPNPSPALRRLTLGSSPLGVRAWVLRGPCNQLMSMHSSGNVDVQECGDRTLRKVQRRSTESDSVG
jgi:hypothetical protein